MFTQRPAHQDISLSSVVAVLLLLTTPGRSATVKDTNDTTASPAPTTQLSNSTVNKPMLLGLRRPCGEKYPDFCQNGGQCMFPQDSDKPFCICTSAYSGIRCIIAAVETNMTRSRYNVEKLIGIIFGVLLLLVFLAFLTSCFCYRKCQKSASLIKSPPSETSV